MDFIRLLFALLIGKCVLVAIKFFGKGGGTAAPGLAALIIYPQLVTYLTRQFPQGSIIVSGTNGKTTTSRLIFTILAKAGIKSIHNRSGSNLLRGIASTLISHANFWGKINADLAIWEVDEAILPDAIEMIHPKIILLGNLFRDQLDRYGEVNSIRNSWTGSVEKLNKAVVLALCADDPGVAILAKHTQAKTIFYGIADENLPQASDQSSDISYCLVCAKPIHYSQRIAAHLGKYQCTSCSFSRPKLDIAAQKIELAGLQILLNIKTGKNEMNIQVKLPGIYNAYNVLAALTLAQVLNIENNITRGALESFVPSFGRAEEFTKDSKGGVILLVKNPTGANQVLSTLQYLPAKNLMIALNDNLADGTDVSWIWDVQFEALANAQQITVSGTRAYELANRLKYAGIPEKNISVQNDIKEALEQSFHILSNKNTLYILPTYTALINLKKVLADQGLTANFWEE